MISTIDDTQKLEDLKQSFIWQVIDGDGIFHFKLDKCSA